MSELTREQTAAFHANMAGVFGATLRDKRFAPEMDVWAEAQALTSRVTPADYRRRFATTVIDCIYLPYEPGVEDLVWTNWNQVIVVTHECRHVQQPGEHGGLVSLAAEGLHTTGTAQIEFEARLTTLELWWWRFGVLYPIDQLANALSEYGCGPRDVEYVRLALEQAALTIAYGGIITDPGRVACAWLEANAPGIKQTL